MGDILGKIVIIFSVLGVCILYSISLVVMPPLVPLEEVALHDGTNIRTSGVLTDMRVSDSGTVLLTIEGNQTDLLVFIDSSAAKEGPSNLSYGDEIEVEGRVQVYKGAYELVVSGNGIKKVTKGSNVSFIAQMATEPEQYEGRRIRVTGYVEDVYTNVLYLRDETGTYRMRVKLMTTISSIAALQEGDKVIAEGVFMYDATTMRYELNVVNVELLPKIPV